MEECFICKEEKDKIQLQSFPCNTCVEGCWYICEKCKDKIIKDFDKCPMCNISISHLKIHIKEDQNNDEENESDDEENGNEEDENYTYYQKLQVQIMKCIQKFA